MRRGGVAEERWRDIGVGEESVVEVLKRSVVQECCREVLKKSVVQVARVLQRKSWRAALERRVFGDEVLEKIIVERCCREVFGQECFQEMLGKSVTKKDSLGGYVHLAGESCCCGCILGLCCDTHTHTDTGKTKNQYLCVPRPAADAFLLRCWHDIGCDVVAAAATWAVYAKVRVRDHF